MTPEEAEAVVRRHLERTPSTPDGPSVSDVAEALRLPPEEVAKLLAEVRAHARRKGRRTISRRERRVWLLSGALALCVGGAGLMAMQAAHVGPFWHGSSATVERTASSVEIFLDGVDRGTVYLDPRKGSTASGMASQVSRWMDANAATYIVPQSYSFKSAQKGIEFAQGGQWDKIEGVKMTPIELRKWGSSGQFLRWGRAIVPIYNGDDALLVEAVTRERDRRLEKALETAMRGVPPPSGPTDAPPTPSPGTGT